MLSCLIAIVLALLQLLFKPLGQVQSLSFIKGCKHGTLRISLLLLSVLLQMALFKPVAEALNLFTLVYDSELKVGTLTLQTIDQGITLSDLLFLLLHNLNHEVLLTGRGLELQSTFRGSSSFQAVRWQASLLDIIDRTVLIRVISAS